MFNYPVLSDVLACPSYYGIMIKRSGLLQLLQQVFILFRIALKYQFNTFWSGPDPMVITNELIGTFFDVNKCHKYCRDLFPSGFGSGRFGKSIPDPDKIFRIRNSGLQ
jgi:hypothetical protein